MRMDVDEQELYPPDAEELTPEARQHRNRVAIGTLLVVWGTSLLVQRALGVDLDTFILGVGLAAVAGWTQVRRYGWFVAGAIGTGAGLASLVSGPHVPFSGTLSNLFIAAGFAAIYVRYPRRSVWALPIAAICALVAVGSFGVSLIGLVPSSLGRLLLPLLLIGGGSLLLVRHSLPPKVVKIGLAGLALTFVLVGATSVPDIDHRPNPLTLVPPTTGVGYPFEARPGQTVVVRTDSGDVRFRRSDSGQARLDVSGGRRGAPLVVEQDGDRLLVGGSGGDGMFGRGGSTDYELWLPDGVGLDVETSSGKVTGVVAAGETEIHTESGDVDLRIEDGGAEGSEDDGPYEIDTESGRVTLEAKVPLDLDLSSDDRVTVNDEDRGDDYRSPKAVTGIEVDVDTESGDVDVTAPQGGPAEPTAPTAPTAPSEPTAPTEPTSPTAPTAPTGSASD
jgi:hypothetical protein